VIFRIKTIIVDDEPFAREKIKNLLLQEKDIRIVGEYGNGYDAVKVVHERNPHLLFLDIQMPGMDGFETLQAIHPDKMPTIIFVTAYDQYALRAFEVHALDYLLKPFDNERFQQSLNRARDLIQRKLIGEVNLQLMDLLENLKENKHRTSRLMIKSGGKVFFIRTNEIDWIEAAGNYIRLHVGEQTHLMRSTMSEMEKQLDPKTFVRIHRSSIVNIDRVRELQPWFNKEYRVILQTGAKLTLSRNYRGRLQNLL